VHLKLSRYDAYALTSHTHQAPFEPWPEVDENGIPAPRPRWSTLRVRLSKVYFGDLIDLPPAEEIGTAHHDSGHVPTAATRPG
jgi:hypothetical protein